MTKGRELDDKDLQDVTGGSSFEPKEPGEEVIIGAGT